MILSKIYINQYKNYNIALFKDSMDWDYVYFNMKASLNTLVLIHFSENKNLFAFDKSPYEHDLILEHEFLWSTKSVIKGAIEFSKDNYATIFDQPNDDKFPSQLVTKKEIAIEMLLMLGEQEEEEEENRKLNIIKKASSHSPILDYEIFIKDKHIYWSITFNNLVTHSIHSKTSWHSWKNKWIYLVAQYNGQEMQIYVDGILLNSKKVSGTLIYQENTPITIGKFNRQNLSAHFILDELHILKKARNVSHIKNYANTIYHLLR